MTEVERIMAEVSFPGGSHENGRLSTPDPTSFRYYAARAGAPKKVDEWVYQIKEGKPGGKLANFYYRDLWFVMEEAAD